MTPYIEPRLLQRRATLLGLPQPISSGVGGSSFVEDPRLAFDRAKILWAATVDPGVVTVTTRTADRYLFDLGRYDHSVVVDEGRVEHVLVKIGSSSLRLDVLAGTVLDGPVGLDARLSLSSGTGYALAACDRLLRLVGLSDPGRRPRQVDRRLPRLVEGLRVLDAHSAGATMAEIAAGLSPDDDVRAQWPGASEHLKSRVRRQVALAKRLVAAGPAGVLTRRV